MSGFPFIGNGFRAEVKVDGQHLRLFSEVYMLGHVAAVYDVNAKREIARHDVENLDTGKLEAKRSAANHLKYVHGITPMPGVEWQINVQSRPI
jgi:hypothetical protein